MIGNIENIEILHEIYNRKSDDIIENYVMIVNKETADLFNGDLQTFKNMPVIMDNRNWSTNRLEVIPNKENVTRVFNYEKQLLDKYIQQLSDVSLKNNLYIGGCGCCGSPDIDGFDTFIASDLKWNGKQYEYTILRRSNGVADD